MKVLCLPELLWVFGSSMSLHDSVSLQLLLPTMKSFMIFQFHRTSWIGEMKETFFYFSFTLIVSDNYSFKFRGSEWMLKLLFPFFSRKSSRIFKGSHQMLLLLISKHTHKHTLCWLQLVTWSDCFAFATEGHSSYQNRERAVSCDVFNFCTYFFETWLTVVHLTNFWCILLLEILNVYSSILLHVSDAAVTNLVHVASL